MTIRNYSNTAPPVSLTVAINTSATTLTVASTAGYPAQPFLLGIERGTANEEVVLCTGVTATSFTVQRGYDGTTAKTHALASSVEHTVSAIDYREANTHVNTPHNIGNMLPTPAIPASSAVGDNAATGIAVEPARADHKHARESFGDPAQSRPGDSMTQGTSASVVRADHVHARETLQELRDMVLPPGMIVPFAHSSGGALTGWIMTYGQAVSRTTYSRLFNVLGTYYGVGDGSTTFNLPDLRGRVIAATDDMGGTIAHRVDIGGSRTLGGNMGTAEVTLTSNQMPIHTHGNDAHNHIQDAHNHQQDPHSHTQNPHTHGISDPGHVHGPRGGGYTFVIASPIAEQHWITGLAQAAGGPGNTQVTYSDIYSSGTGISITSTLATNNPNYAAIYSTTATNQSATINIQNSGGGQAHNNMQPTIFLYYYIKI